ncbi:fasciclin domain-containing protein [Xylariales sp. AK1849]|nr:fasciclin domain-containing protein [Xylariales sp. AK1849]
MQFKQVLSLALASSVSAQSTESLTNALNGQNSSLSTLNSLLQSTGLGTQLSAMRNVTILAPDNNALAALLNNTGAVSTLTDTSAIAALLQYHILNGTYMADSFNDKAMFIPTALTNQSYANVTGGQRVEALTSDGNVTFYTALKQNSTVVTPNVNFTGGVIHIVNTLLSIPQNDTITLSDANLTAAAGAIRASGLERGLGDMSDITIFAPNNEAFNSVGSVLANLSTEGLASVLGYHVVNNSVLYSTDFSNQTLRSSSGEDLRITVLNGTVFVNAARVTVPDIFVSNGVVHVIDQVLNSANSTETPDASATSVMPAYTSASTGTAGIPFTSGIATPTTTFPAATSGGAGAASSSKSNPAMPMKTGAVGAAALFGGAAILANF